MLRLTAGRRVFHVSCNQSDHVNGICLGALYRSVGGPISTNSQANRVITWSLFLPRIETLQMFINVTALYLESFGKITEKIDQMPTLGM